MKSFLLNEKNAGRNAFIWNMVASLCSSFQTMIFMLIMTRRDNMDDASYIAIAYSVANLMMMIGKYGIRNYQATDVSEKFSFGEYKESRRTTTVLMVVGTALYIGYRMIFSNYEVAKAVVVALICLLKLVEVVEDVFHGRLQQRGRIEVASKILGIRNMLIMVSFIALYLVTNQLILSLIITIAITAFLALWLNNMVKQELNDKTENSDVREDISGDAAALPDMAKENKGFVQNLGLRVLLQCLPVFLISFINMYIGNAPKFMVDAVVSNEIQATFNVLFMTLYVIALLSNMLYVPVLNKLAVYIKEDEKKKFMKNFTIQIGCIIGITIFALVFCMIIGRDILGWIYKINLDGYKTELYILLISGGIIAFMNFANACLITFRGEKLLLVILGTCAIETFIVGTKVLSLLGLKAMCVAYMVCLGVNAIFLLAAMIYKIISWDKVRKEINNAL